MSVTDVCWMDGRDLISVWTCVSGCVSVLFTVVDWKKGLWMS